MDREDIVRIEGGVHLTALGSVPVTFVGLKMFTDLPGMAELPIAALVGAVTWILLARHFAKKIE